MPELAKFTAIAKLFNVSTDWLLCDDDSEPISPENNSDYTSTRPNLAEEISDGYISIISKLWRAYGWIMGIIMMIGGAGMLSVALFGMVAFVNMGTIAENMFDAFDYGYGYGDVVGSMTSRVSTVPIVGIVIGALIFACGLVFFIVHRKKYGRK